MNAKMGGVGENWGETWSKGRGEWEGKDSDWSRW